VSGVTQFATCIGTGGAPSTTGWFDRTVQVHIGQVAYELLGHHGLEGRIVDGGGHGHWAPGAGGDDVGIAAEAHGGARVRQRLEARVDEVDFIEQIAVALAPGAG
jgi:hypothetical protein